MPKSKQQQSQLYYGPKLYPWQKDVVDEICDKKGTGRVVVVSAPRQRGKSYMCEGILLYTAINQPQSISAIISPTLSQSRKVFKEIINAVYESGVIRRKNETLLEIELINGSQIFFKSSEMRDSLRGYHTDGILILDEASYLGEDILELVLPWRQVSNCPMLIVSTPKMKDGMFYNYFLQGVNEENNIKTINWADYDTSCMISKEMIEQYRKSLTINQFKSEILGEFLDGDGMVFSNIKINATGDQYMEIDGEYYIGIDWANGNTGDYTALSIFNGEGEMVYIDYFNDLGTYQQIERIIRDLEPFRGRIKSIYAENNSIGSPFIDLLISECNKKDYRDIVAVIKRWTTSNSSKNTLVNQLQVALETCKIKLLKDKMLISQLESYEAEYNPKTQTVSYNGAFGTHDDLCIATMLGWNAYINSTRQGQYCFSF